MKYVYPYMDGETYSEYVKRRILELDERITSVRKIEQGEKIEIETEITNPKELKHFDLNEIRSVIRKQNSVNKVSVHRDSENGLLIYDI